MPGGTFLFRLRKWKRPLNRPPRGPHPNVTTTCGDSLLGWRVHERPRPPEARHPCGSMRSQGRPSLPWQGRGRAPGLPAGVPPLLGARLLVSVVPGVALRLGTRVAQWVGQIKNWGRPPESRSAGRGPLLTFGPRSCTLKLPGSIAQRLTVGEGGVSTASVPNADTDALSHT
jgi:hypothetical protein